MDVIEVTGAEADALVSVLDAAEAAVRALAARHGAKSLEGMVTSEPPVSEVYAD